MRRACAHCGEVCTSYEDCLSRAARRDPKSRLIAQLTAERDRALARVAELEADPHVADLHENCRAEVERLRVHQRGLVDAWAGRWESLRQQNEALRAALRRYGRHSSRCKLNGQPLHRDECWQDCDCGAQAALDAALGSSNGGGEAP